MPPSRGAGVLATLVVASLAAAHIVPHNARLAKVALRAMREPADPACAYEGRFAQGQVVARLAPNGILARAKVKGLTAGCEGETLAFSLTLRSSIDHCPDGDCPPTDDRLAAGACIVRSGRCTITTFLRSPYPPGAGSEVTLQACGLRHGAIDAFACSIPPP